MIKQSLGRMLRLSVLGVTLVLLLSSIPRLALADYYIGSASNTGCLPTDCDTEVLLEPLQSYLNEAVWQCNYDDNGDYIDYANYSCDSNNIRCCSVENLVSCPGAFCSGKYK